MGGRHPRHAGQEAKMNTFEGIPAELRLEVYKQLLVTDCAFRLAHFGPFSHVPHKPLHSSILRTNKAIYAEAREVLYGHNTFFLGPTNHKPTYTASLPENIGQHNTSLVRFVVLHSTLYSCLDRQDIERFLAAQSIDANQLKVLAISMPEDSPLIHVIPRHPLVPLSATLGSHHIGQWLNATQNTTATAVTVSSAVNSANNPVSFNTGLQQQLPAQLAQPLIPPLQPSPSVQAELSEETIKLIQAVIKCGGWVEICAGGRRGVEELGIKTLNCDIRAGEGWVVRVSPGVRRNVEVLV